MERLAAFDDYQRNRFRGADFAVWLGEHWEIPLVAGALYLIMVFAGPKLMANREAFTARWSFTAWNLMLCVFSIFGTYYTAPALINALTKHGLHFTVCERVDSWCADGLPGFWGAAFCLSKIVEFADTFFLIIRKRPIIFLQWYHHITVMVFCWYAENLAAPGLWFTVMNFFVHAVMYGYFAMMSASAWTRKMVKPVALVVTFLQLTQMVIGTGIAVYTAHQFELGPGCGIDATLSRAALGMYGSYLLLFAVLFRQLYFSNAKGGEASSKKRGTAPRRLR
jgi:hypothetical protein